MVAAGVPKAELVAGWPNGPLVAGDWPNGEAGEPVIGAGVAGAGLLSAKGEAAAVGCANSEEGAAAAGAAPPAGPAVCSRVSRCCTACGCDAPYLVCSFAPTPGPLPTAMFTCVTAHPSASAI